MTLRVYRCGGGARSFRKRTTWIAGHEETNEASHRRHISSANEETGSVKRNSIKQRSKDGIKRCKRIKEATENGLL
jgi:hypothetical protein